MQTFAETISNSCNPAFIQIGELVGAERFFKYFTGFGFTEKTGIDMLSESKVTSELYHDTSELGETQLAASSFGQTFKVTPIQMITGHVRRGQRRQADAALCGPADPGFRRQCGRKTWSRWSSVR